MSIYECPRAEDAAGYVLRAMPDGEWESYRYHVAECRDCTAKVQELGFVSHALLSAVPQLSAPPDIRGRVMSIVRAESELLLASGASADRVPERRSRGFGLGFARWRPMPAAALASVLIALGLGVGTLLSSGPGTMPCKTRAASVTPAGTTAKVEVCGGNARLALAGLQAPTDGRIYQLWLDDPNDHEKAKSVSVFSPHDGDATVDVGKLHGHPMLLVTEEQYPNGSSIPTSEPIVKAVA